MNIHRPAKAVLDKHPQWEFIGKRWKNRFTWMRARNKVFGHVWFYNFEHNELHDDAGYKHFSEQKEG